MLNLTALIFAVLSLVFAFFALRDYLRGGHKLSLSAKVWLRIAIIFAVVAIALTVMV